MQRIRIPLIYKAFVVIVALFIGLVVPKDTFSYEIEPDEDAYVSGHFKLGPTQIEITSEPGEDGLYELQLTNYTGEDRVFSIFTRDFEGTQDPNQFTTILEDTKSDYGASGWITPEIDEISLAHGEKLVFEVKVSVPEYADAGEHYSALLVQPKDAEKFIEGGSVIGLHSRIGSLFLVDVAGRHIKQGAIADYFTSKPFYENLPVDISIDVKNSGTSHLKPSGTIKIYNIFGGNTDELTVDEFTVLRESVRRKTVNWDNGFRVGLYKAKLNLNLGISGDDLTGTVQFWVIPWKILLLFFIIIIILLLILKYFTSKFEFEVKIK